MSHKLLVFTDGGARGNPGPAAAGVIIQNETGQTLFRQGKYLGHKTNNEAEYAALLLALEWLEKNPVAEEEICFYSDSRLLVQQLKGKWRIKAAGLKPLVEKIRQKIEQLGKRVFFVHLSRQSNVLADRLVNLTLDRILGQKR